MPTRFLTADWRHVCLLTYACPKALLEPRCPPGTELELLDGKAHVSLVAFDFLRTRVWGIGWPGFRNFPEINLRFYVTSGDRRGVVFIREYVPSRFVAWLARVLYNEPYKSAEMASDVAAGEGEISVRHRLRVGGSKNTLRIVVDNASYMPGVGSLEHHFKEHHGVSAQPEAGGLARPVSRAELELGRGVRPRMGFLARARSSLGGLGSGVADRGFQLTRDRRVQRAQRQR